MLGRLLERCCRSSSGFRGRVEGLPGLIGGALVEAGTSRHFARGCISLGLWRECI